MSYYGVVRSPDYLEHHGILGMKWGIRRYQNPDGSLTEEGKKRYGDILTKDQMNNMVKNYNLRTGNKKKITKKTVFKTKNGTYDYKGRRIDTETEVESPEEDREKKKNPKHMGDQELQAAVQRLRNINAYNEEYAKLHSKKKSNAQKFVNNLKEDLIRDIPAGLSQAVKNGLVGALVNSKTGNGENDNNKTITAEDKSHAGLGSKERTVSLDPKTKSTPVSSIPTPKEPTVRPLFSSGPSNNSAAIFSTGVAKTRIDDIRSDYYRELWEDSIRHSAIFGKRLKEIGIF